MKFSQYFENDYDGYGNVNKAIQNIKYKFQYFFQYNPDTKTNGWKLSIQGKNEDDIKFLLLKLYDYLMENRISFKFATLKLLKDKDAGEQKNKIITIYCSKDIKILDLAKEVAKRIKGYNGFKGIKPTGYTYFKQGIYYRNDTDKSGNYILPK